MRELLNTEYDAVSGGRGVVTGINFSFVKKIDPAVIAKIDFSKAITFSTGDLKAVGHLGVTVPANPAPAGSAPGVSFASVSIVNGVITQSTSGNAFVQADASTGTLPNGQQFSSASVYAYASS